MIDISNAVSKHKAIAIAQRWLDTHSDPKHDYTVDTNTVMERQHVFVVWYNTERYLLTQDILIQHLGTSPFVIDRYTGEIIGRPPSVVGFWDALKEMENAIEEKYFLSKDISAQYTTDVNLKIRQFIHANHTIGQPLEPWLDSHLALEPDAALLDVGTANGAFPIRLRQAGHRGHLVGVDLSSGMIALAREQSTDVEFLVADAMALPFADSSFDVVTARHMLYHVPDIHKALLECKRILKPNGRFFALTNADGYLADYWAVILETLQNLPEFEDFIADHLSSKFFHKDLWQQIKKVFGETELHIKPQHLEFTSAAAPLAYWHSMQAGKGIAPDVWEAASQKLEAAFATKTQTPWRIQKDVALLKTRDG